MNKEELLAKAIKDYPIGTVFLSVISNDPMLSMNIPYWSNYNSICTKPSANGVVYKDNIWAKIISYPKGYIRSTKYLFY